MTAERDITEKLRMTPVLMRPCPVDGRLATDYEATKASVNTEANKLMRAAADEIDRLRTRLSDYDHKLNEVYWLVIYVRMHAARTGVEDPFIRANTELERVRAGRDGPTIGTKESTP